LCNRPEGDATGARTGTNATDEEDDAAA